MKENSFGRLGEMTVETLEQAMKTTELFRLEREMSGLMDRMENLLGELRQLEAIRLEQTKLLMCRDAEQAEQVPQNTEAM